MNSNFQFLKTEFTAFHNRAVKAEQLVITDPRTSLIYSRMALEEAINWMYTNDEDLEQQHNTTLHNLLVQPEFKKQFNHKLYNELFIIKSAGNLAAHNKAVNEIDSHKAIEALFYFGKWFIKSYAQESVLDIGIFDFDFIPKAGGNALSRKQIKHLQEQLDKELNVYQEQLKTKEAERQQLAEENELFKKQIETLQAQIEANKVEANVEDEVYHPRNEVETRIYLIDVALREAGWDLKGINDKEYKVAYMPESTNISETGYVDYVLWDDDGLPLALVEAKRTMESASKGENQAQLYADSLEKMHGRRPVMYYSNGYEIFLWDDQFYKQSRPVHGFYTKAELQTAMFRRTHRKDIRTAPIDTEIAGRSYQMRAIKSIAEHFAGNDKSDGKLIGTNRGALLVLATGTGKTRTSIAFSKLMLECNWAKRILFLADRTSLVDQAKRNFVKHLPEHTSVNLLEEKDNPDARFAFSTYQTMMGLIDRSRDEEARFYGVGHFDLIIIDEAHRSIYKKYQAIFEYFDGLFLGLTATPKNSIDKNTYHIFGLADKSPTDAYTFEEAVNNVPRHLNPYKTIPVPTKFMTEGIRYDELSDEEKEEFEEEILDGEEATGNEWISSSELNSWLFNKPTAIETLQYVLKHGIKKLGGDELGKTIIFAKNRKHAQFLKDTFMELDKEQFGNDYVKVITHNEPKAKEFINRFCDEEKDRLPQIAISVDMMDTGIDAPSCVNLVFYKPVKSYSKFWQMIGRGSRLRPDLFGAGQDKTHFLIFDLCGNFEFFNENPEGIESSSQKSLTEILFGLRLRLAEYLKSNQFKEDNSLQNFRAELLDGLHKDIAILDLERFDVRMKLEIVHEFGNENREIWNHLSKRDTKRIEDELASLVKPQKGDTDLARFYDKLLFTLIIKRLETPNNEEYINSFMIPISKIVGTSRKLLKKTTIPAVKSKEELIKLPLEEDFWKLEGIVHLEKLRKGVRELVKYIDPVDQRYVTTDFADYIIEDKIVLGGMVSEGDPVYAPSPFQNNVYRLEELVRKNENHITISRIRKGEAITKEELQALEDILFTGGIEKEAIEKELGTQFSLVKFIISLMGLSPEKVDAAFAKFINDFQLNAVQIEFLDTIKKFLTTNGTIEPSKLYDSPFKNFHSMGIDGVFTEKQADVIFKIVEDFNQAN
ncbi:DEAD/DEAH box helicase family protein [Aquimarina algiphila]|uniref:DEAD/DEAH box helicase family protein n=1 Tax=Aquimarina algiphila TaxID=2047982 RepID=UPI0024922902|nr:DEAD/DEAH box helicase family protein [Aquimarina algiphila]